MGHILIVDDDPQLRQSFEKLLTAEGHRVRTAATGETALEMGDDWSIIVQGDIDHVTRADEPPWCASSARPFGSGLSWPRGAMAMGFDQEKTTHHFVLTSDGGLIEARANDIRDTASVGQIRGHFQHIVHLFAEGNFNAPMLVHSQDVPGTATMARLKGDLHWELQELPRGARITITADNKEALDAVHDFLRFQIADHITGDCTAVR